MLKNPFFVSNDDDEGDEIESVDDASKELDPLVDSFVLSCEEKSLVKDEVVEEFEKVSTDKENIKVKGKQCDQCGKIFSTKQSLEYHLKVHSRSYDNKCDGCGKSYIKSSRLQECKNTHAGIFKFSCDQCEYKTNNTNLFNRHAAIHSTEKLFTCPLCSHPSRTAQALREHVTRVHHKTLCQAEVFAKKNRFGQIMTDDDLNNNNAGTKTKVSKIKNRKDSVVISVAKS